MFAACALDMTAEAMECAAGVETRRGGCALRHAKVGKACGMVLSVGKACGMVRSVAGA